MFTTHCWICGQSLYTRNAADVEPDPTRRRCAAHADPDAERAELAKRAEANGTASPVRTGP